MKKVLLICGFSLFTVSISAQSRLHKIDDGIRLKSQNSFLWNKKKPVLKNLNCQDTLRYAEAKEQTLSSNPTYYFQELWRADNEEISMAFLSSFSSSIHGVEILARRSSSSQPNGVVVQASIYSASQSFEPSMLIGSATITITDNVNFNYYNINFPVPLNVSGNYCVVVKPITTDGIIDLYVNDVNVSSHDELLCRFKSDYYPSSSGQWIAIPSFSEYTVQPANFEPLVAPIVSYNLGTQIISSEQVICKDEILTLNSQVTPSGIYGNRFYNWYSFWSYFNTGTIDSTLNWQTPNNLIANNSYGAQTSVQYNSVAQHSISLFNEFGFYSNCLDQDTIIITINEPNTSAGNDIVICEGESVTLTATGANSYNWNNNVLNGQPFTPNNSGSYIVEGLSTFGCIKKDTLSLTVNPITTPTFVQVEPYCQNATPAILPTTSDNGILGTWIPATISSATVGTATYTFTPTSTTSPTCAAVTTMAVTINSLPNVILALFNSVCDTAGLVNLTGGSPAGGTYSGTSISNNSFNTAIGLGTYPITYNFSDNNGCSSSATSNLTVIDCSGASFVELTVNEISVYPNPTDNIFTIEVSDFIIGQTFTVYDIRGRLLLNGKLNETKTPINVSSFATGTYYVNLPESNKMIKIIKQ